jgi:hypothetical protein
MERMRMNKTFEQGRDEIAKLCRYFETNQQAFLAPGVKEAHVRQSLIDPFFEALGWDVRNTAQVAPQYREVIPEDSLDVEGHQKAPDYTFRVGTLPKFYAEAKKCGVNINADPAPAYQLRRYGWNARVALSLLTDFEELGIYDCTLRPHPSDKASRARIQYFRFEEYPDCWRELWDKFSRDAVWSGAFDQFAASKRKRGTSEVDAEFLKEIEGWRDILARNIALRNTNLSSDDLNTAVQRTIDRIVFLRMAEDRGIEPYEQLMKLCERPDIYPRFMRDLCRKADEKYNSGLFHFQKEEGVSEPPDRLTPRLMVDDKVFKPILQGLYFSHGSPYHFGVLPVEILGTVYERFLGKVIRLTAGHQAKVEEKPEVRKAGGVYYTPSYIVDYIVKNTVGKQVEGKSPARLAGGNPPKADKPPFRVLDMACGSGSFLLGAYRLLLDHCLKWYMENNPKKHPTAVQRNQRTGEWRLMIEEKKRILTTHIFGVDIDSQAVEVTKLSLLLKVLEGETSETIHEDFLISKKRALPNLADNIKCGNSLIGSDYFTGTMFPDPDELKRVNPFDWRQGFPDAMQSGGFDCIIGNPPYIFTRNQRIPESQKAYFYRKYKHQSIQLNTFGLFVEQAYSLLKLNGFVGFIMPNNWLTIDTFTPLRRFILQNTGDIRLTNILDRVFAAANVDTCVITFQRTNPKNLTVAEMKDQSVVFERSIASSEIVKPSFIIQLSLLKDANSKGLLAKIESTLKPLYCFARVSTGVKAYQTGKGKPRQTDKQKKNRLFHAKKKLDVTYGRYLTGADVSRYYLGWSGEWLRYGDWLAEPRHSVPFDGERILIRQIPASPPYLIHAVISEEKFYHDINSMVIFAPITDISLKFLLGIINSRLISLWFQKKFDKLQRKTFPQFKVKELASFPIPIRDLSEPSDRTHHDCMVQLVNSMLALHKQLASANSVSQKEIIQRQIDATDAEIDRMVYELYGLTDDEIFIVESYNITQRNL